MATDPLVELGYLLVPAVTLVFQGWLVYWVVANRREERETTAFLVMTGAGMIWMLAVMGHIVADDRTLELWTFTVWVISSYGSVAAFVVFGSQYTNRDFHRRPLAAAAIGFVAVGYPLLVLTNGSHNLVWTDYTPVSEPFTYLAIEPGPLIGIVTLLLTLLGLYTEFVMGKYLLSTRRRSGWQIVLLIVGALAITSLEYLSYTGIFPATWLSHAPYGAFFFYGFTAIALFQFNLFDLKPVARSAIVEKLHDPVLVVDRNRAIVDYNEQCHTLWPEVDERIGDPVADVVPELEDTVAFPNAGETSHTQLTLSRDGQDRHFSAKVSRVEQGRGGDDDWFAILLRDVTALEQSRWQLERQNERLDQVAATISHDLRNPIQVASGHVELIDSGLADGDADDGRAELRTHVATTTDALERMDTIIEDVLTIAREGKTVDETEPVDLRTAARDAWATAETGTATLSIDGDRTIAASPSRFSSILENLFRNAWEHGPDDVTVTVGPTPTGFSVADDGPGIPPEETDRVFETGYTTGEDGTGLGLAIVQTMAESHGWTVELDPTHQDGTKFVFAGVSDAGSSDDSELTPLVQGVDS